MTIKTSYLEVTTLKEAMNFWKGNKSEAARELGINRGSLRTYLEDESKLVRVIRSDSYIIGFELINQ